MIDLENATKTYRCGDETINAVDGVNLRIRDGEYVAIVGHSGSGKTTLVSLVGGLTRPTSGTVRMEGTDIWSLNNKELARLRSEEIGFCFQFPSLVATLTCVDNVRLPASFAAGQRGSRERAMELLELVALPGKAGAYPSEL
ncbi:MAG TPA: ATP-binding cassette domain-containing protein, partial [Actinobacteria bacterium]|nr:ATP-binding cassette domain-containing protein [Actinomycetota bacterium]